MGFRTLWVFFLIVCDFQLLLSTKESVISMENCFAEFMICSVEG
jgi:hypothetical protein